MIHSSLSICVLQRLLYLLLTTAVGAQSSLLLELPLTDPGMMGFSAEKFEQMKQHLHGYVDNRKLPGIITVVVRKDNIVYADKYGRRDIENDLPMQWDTIFRLASMTKPITSVAAMMLYEEGRLRLDDPVAKYIPEFSQARVYVAGGDPAPLNRQLTIQDMLTHTSGITAGLFGNTGVHQLYRGADLGEAGSLSEFVRRLAALPLLHQPGAGWAYGHSTDVVARIVEVVSGQPFDRFLTERILQPLKMGDSGFSISEEKLPRLATPYSARSGDSLTLVNAPISPDFPRGVSGLLSTTGDYLRFARLLLHGGTLDGVRLLKPETVALMTRNHLPDSLIPIAAIGRAMPNNGFGLGFGVVVDNQDSPPDANGFWWNRGAPPIGTYWWVGAYHTYFWVDPSNEIVGLLMTQSPDMAFSYMQEFHTLVYEAFGNGRGKMVNGKW